MKSAQLLLSTHIEITSFKLSNVEPTSHMFQLMERAYNMFLPLDGDFQQPYSDTRINMINELYTKC